MSTQTLRPDSSSASGTSIGGGAASRHAACNDDSDATYVHMDSNGSHVRFTVDDWAVPAGSVVSKFKLRVRRRLEDASFGKIGQLKCKLGAGSDSKEKTEQMVNGTPSTSTPIVWDEPIVASKDPDVLFCRFERKNSNTKIRVVEAYVDVVHVTQPTVIVDEPSTTPITDDPQPTVEWSSDFDDDAADARQWQVKVFTKTVYDGVGFDPDTSTAEYDSGERSGTDATHKLEEPLDDDTYRFMVRVGSVEHEGTHWSDWDEGGEIVLDIDRPGTPTHTTTVQTAQGRVSIALSDSAGAATTDLFESQYSDDGGVTWLPLRTAAVDGYASGKGYSEPDGSGDAQLYDYEAPSGVERLYRHRALHDYSGVLAAGAWTANIARTFTPDRWWFKSPTSPSLNLSPTVFSEPGDTREFRMESVAVLGKAEPVTVKDVLAGASGTIVVDTDDATDQAALDALLEDALPVLVQAPADDNWTERWVQFGGRDRTRHLDKLAIEDALVTLPWVEADRPGGDLAE